MKLEKPGCRDQNLKRRQNHLLIFFFCLLIHHYIHHSLIFIINIYHIILFYCKIYTYTIYMFFLPFVCLFVFSLPGSKSVRKTFFNNNYQLLNQTFSKPNIGWRGGVGVWACELKERKRRRGCKWERGSGSIRKKRGCGGMGIKG